MNLLITGLDNLNNYYDPSLKEYRLKVIEVKAGKHPEHKYEFVKGDIADLQGVNQDACLVEKVVVNLHIVQTCLSKADASADILQLLSVVKNYAYEVCNASFAVCCSE